MSDNKITQDQLEPNVMEELESGIGDLSTLSTENKDSLVAAVTEIYGKNIIAEAIGEPLAVTDTFNEMGNEINGLLSSFKTNMMNSGVTVESGDKFKQLIEKIKGLSEGEGNKGIQFAEGTFENLIIDNTDNDTSVPLQVNLDLDFVPNMLFIKIGHSINADLIGGSAEAIICNMFDSTFYSNYSTNYGYTTTYLISDVTQTKCTITRKLNYNTSDEDTYLRTTILGFYAIGVGEEDTTLRDSLASILTEEGVSVTEEDNMASLIGKVDSEFDRQVVPVGDATVEDVIAGKTFMNNMGELLTGALVSGLNKIKQGSLKTDTPAGRTLVVSAANIGFKPSIVIIFCGNASSICIAIQDELFSSFYLNGYMFTPTYSIGAGYLNALGTSSGDDYYILNNRFKLTIPVHDVSSATVSWIAIGR